MPVSSSVRVLTHNWYLADERSFSSCSWWYSKYLINPTKSNLSFKSLNLLSSMKVGSSNTVLSNLWNLLSICRYHEKFQQDSDNIQIWLFFFLLFSYLVHFCAKKIISLGMWTKHNTPYLLVILLNEFIAYTYTHIYIHMCAYVYMYWTFIFCI